MNAATQAGLTEIPAIVSMIKPVPRESGTTSFEN